MFGVTWHDVISGMAGNAGWAAFGGFLFLIRYVGKRIKIDGAGRTLIRGLLSSLLLFVVAIGIVFVLFESHGKGFYSGFYFLAYSLTTCMYLYYYASFNRNWIVPLLKLVISRVRHIFDISRPEYKPVLPPTLANINSLVDQMDEAMLTSPARRSIDKVLAFGPAAVEHLIQALQHRRQNVRANAAIALGLTNDQRPILPLVDCLKDDSDVLRHTAATIALGNLGSLDLPLLAEAARSDKECVRRGAIRALGNCKDLQALEVLGEIAEEWKKSTLAEGDLLFHDYKKLLEEHRNFFYSRLDGEERANKTSSLLSDAFALERRVRDYFEFRSWQTPVQVAEALRQTAEDELKKANTPH